MRNYITYLMIAISCMAMITGCYTEKKASRQTVKAFTQYPDLISGYCGLWFDPVVMTKDSFIYKPGQIIYKKGEPVYVQVDCDSVVKNSTSANKTAKVKCPPCDSVRVDTVYRSKESTEVNRAKEHSLEATVKEQGETIAGQKVTINILRWTVILLGIYTLARWILRIWNIKLP